MMVVGFEERFVWLSLGFRKIFPRRRMDVVLYGFDEGIRIDWFGNMINHAYAHTLLTLLHERMGRSVR